MLGDAAGRGRVRRGERHGSATVELAVLLVLLIPALLYVLSVQELLVAKLENQEAIVSSTWDLSEQDYRNQSATTVVGLTQAMSRQTYLDHTSAWNDYAERRPEARARQADARLHRSRRAHPCWYAEGVKAVTCRLDERAGRGLELDGRFVALAEHRGGRGRLVECSAALAVHDASLPADFMQWWARRRVRPGTEALLFPEDRLAMVVDPWALGWLKKRTGGPARGHHEETLLDPAFHPASEQSQFASWVKVPYGTHQRTGPADELLQDLIDEGFLSTSAGEDGVGDALDTPPIAFKVTPGEDFDGYQPSGHADRRVEETRRVRSYLGLPETLW